MTITKVSVEVEQLAVTSAGMYTVPGSTTSVITHAVATNVDATDNTTFTILVNGATYIPARVIGAGKSDPCPELIGMVLETTDTVGGSAGAASDINFRMAIEETAV